MHHSERYEEFTIAVGGIGSQLLIGDVEGDGGFMLDIDRLLAFGCLDNGSITKPQFNKGLSQDNWHL